MDAVRERHAARLAAAEKYAAEKQAEAAEKLAAATAAVSARQRTTGSTASRGRGRSSPGGEGIMTQRNLMVIGAAFAIGAALTSRGTGIIVIIGLVCALSQFIPADRTFDAFFQRWFLEDFYPNYAEAYRQGKWNKQGLLGAIKSFIHEKTEALHGSVVYEVVRTTALPARIVPYFFFKLAYVDATALGVECGDAYQSSIVFIGAGNRWFLNPIQMFGLANMFMR